MRFERLMPVLRDLLAEYDHPDVSSVETAPMPGNDHPPSELRVTFTDGTTMILHVVRTAPPGGEPDGTPEKIVYKSGHEPVGG
jgi:hypothetical protein